MLAASLAFAVAGGLLVLLPGPDTLVVLRALVRSGRRTALLTVLGVLTGLAVWVLAAVLGLAALLRASEDAYTALRIVGAVYLLWLGIQSWRNRSSLELGSADDGGHHGQRRSIIGHGFRAGLLTDLLNPKVGVFFVTFLPGFVPAGTSVPAASAVFGAVYLLETGVYFAVLLVAAAPLLRWMSRARVRRAMDRVTGSALIGFGVRLATER
ncbi:MAG: LysE family translocator [Actinomycetes bacterium]